MYQVHKFNRRAAKPVAAPVEEVLPYYTVLPAVDVKLRDYTPLEQMYAYFNFE